MHIHIDTGTVIDADMKNTKTHQTFDLMDITPWMWVGGNTNLDD